MNEKEFVFKYLDNLIYNFLYNNVDFLPIRFTKFLANFYPDARIRKIYWKKLGVVFGENSFANLGMRIASNDFEERIIIGNNVSIAPNLTFITESTANNGQEINTLPYVKNILTKEGNIIVEDEVWIGASVTILPGVRIGRCSVIGAGSTVINDVEPYSVYVGNPARKIRDLKTGERV